MTTQNPSQEENSKPLAQTTAKRPWRVVKLGFLAITGLALTAPLAYAATQIVFKESFDKGFAGQWEEELCCSHSAQTVSSPVRYDEPGSRAAKFTLKRGESERAEVRLDSVRANSEYTYKFSVYLPESHVPSSTRDILSQLKETPDHHLGEEHKSPPFHLATTEGRWEIHRRWDSNPLTRNNDPEGTETINLGRYETDKWTDWKFHIKYSHQSDGLLEVFKNGKLVVRKRGPNTYNDRTGPYFKIGVYNPQLVNSNLPERKAFFDAVRVYKH